MGITTKRATANASIAESGNLDIGFGIFIRPTEAPTYANIY